LSGARKLGENPQYRGVSTDEKKEKRLAGDGKKLSSVPNKLPKKAIFIGHK